MVGFCQKLNAKKLLPWLHPSHSSHSGPEQKERPLMAFMSLFKSGQEFTKFLKCVA